MSTRERYRIAEKLLREARESGGVTLDARGLPAVFPYRHPWGAPAYNYGFLVGVRPRMSASVRPDDIDAAARWTAVIPTLGVDEYVGSWLNPATGRVDLDVSRWYPNVRHALAAARQARQATIYDLHAQTDIEVV